MTKKNLSLQHLEAFRSNLIREEKSTATIEKYMRDVKTFFEYSKSSKISKELILAYKQNLLENGYAIRSINSMLASINCFLTFLGLSECKVKTLNVQRQSYCAESEELTKAEYLRLLDACRGNMKLRLVLQTICGTGIRVSELKYFTVEAIQAGELNVRCKNKTRTILVPGKLKKMLLAYAMKAGISSGLIFVSRNGKALDRSNIWAQMKRLCSAAGVNPSKVFPHNLRKLFARTFYKYERDIAKLADILGHSSIDTTRIYIISTCTEHRKKMDRLGLVV